MNNHFSTLGIGGTFDHFHIGHRYFLDFAAAHTDELYVGITTQIMTDNKVLSQLIEEYEVREKNVIGYLKNKNVKHIVFPLSDPYGPTLQDAKVEAVAVTELTKNGGEAINEKRNELKLAALPVLVSSLLKDETSEYISSTRIRQGKIDRKGSVYSQVFTKDLLITEQQKNFFRQRQGNVVRQPSQTFANTYVVGDVVLETFLENRWPFHLGIYDQRNLRKEYSSKFNVKPTGIVENPAGIITSKLFHALEVPSDNSLLLINGEEDLAAVALVLSAPLQSAIYYGQPGEGMVEMIVTEDLKTQFFSVLHGA